MSLHLPAASVLTGELTPEQAGWEFTGLRIMHLAGGDSVMLDLGRDEAAVVPLSGSFVVEAGETFFALEGRQSVFAAPTDLCFVPAGGSVTVSSAKGGEVAIGTARAEPGGQAFYVPSSLVEVEVRGSGRATRQVNQLLGAAISGPQRLIVVEVITPDGNWSSYPPHKHDEYGRTECPLEEIYYFRFTRPGAFGLHRTYTLDRSIDETVTVRDGDVFLIPRGYHGPCAAAPGYPMYYLNVMAGPGPRSWLITTDPAHAWLWDEWGNQKPDDRVPWKERSA